MPAMNGWEFLENYRKLEKRQHGKVVIIMLTTSLNPDDKIRAQKNLLNIATGFYPIVLALLLISN
jgi:CheY-like chemotaxis protein